MSCPTLVELEEVLAGTAAPAVQGHVSDCASCTTALAGIKANLDLARGLRSAIRPEPEPTLERAPPLLPGYRLLGLLNAGAQGAVYQAIQESTRRTVAIKFLHHGVFSTPRQRRRFEREIDMVASLRHPGIVTVHECGTTGDQLYCVMEFVDGVSIDAAVRASGSSPRAVVPLFVKVCEAVHHAHLHGVLHRDLKPANVFVDRQGQPRILDFGLARAIGGADAEEDDRSALLTTRAGEFLGTLAYASPEQLDADPARIDVRSDVYSLGVILYELLTGERPYPSSSNLAQSVRAIQEAIPGPPSRVARGIDRDLDTIALHALAKDRERRYGSAAAFADDLGHWLLGRPIEARREHTLYVLQKALRRHWLVSSAILLVCVVSIAAALVSNHYRGVADDEALAAAVARGHAEDESRRAAEEAARAREIAQSEREQAAIAERRAKESERVRALLEELITANDPERALGRDLSVREVLESAGPSIVAALADEPLVQARLQLAIGRAYTSLRRPDKAGPMLETAVGTFERRLGRAQPDTLDALDSLLALRLQEARWEEAEAMALDALARLEGGALSTRRLAANLWASASAAAYGRTELPVAIERAARALELLESSPEPVEVELAQARVRLAVLKGHHDALEPAEELMASALEILRRHRDRRPALLVHALLEAQVLARLRRGYQDSVQLLREAHDLCSRMYGAEDSYTLRIELAMLDAQWRANDFRDGAPEVAQAIGREALLLQREDPNALEALLTIANFASSTLDNQRAERLSRYVFESCIRLGRPDDPIQVGATAILGSALVFESRLSEAEPILERSLRQSEALRGSMEKVTHKTAVMLLFCRSRRMDGTEVESLAKRAIGAIHPDVRESSFQLIAEAEVGQFLTYLDLHELAEKIGTHTLERMQTQHADNLSGISKAANLLAETIRERGRLDEALELAELALDCARRASGETGLIEANALQEISINLRYREQLRPALEKIEEAVAIYDEVADPASPYRLTALRNLGVLRLFCEEYPAAILPLEELVEVYRERPNEAPVLGELLSHLGQAYAGAEQYQAADDALGEGYELLARFRRPGDDWLKGTLGAWISVNQKLGRADEVERLQGLGKSR